MSSGQSDSCAFGHVDSGCVNYHFIESFVDKLQCKLLELLNLFKQNTYKQVPQCKISSCTISYHV